MENAPPVAPVDRLVRHPLSGRLNELVMPQECIRVCEKHGYGYLQWHADSDERAKRREQQLKCSICCRWKWEPERCNLFEPSGSSFD